MTRNLGAPRSLLNPTISKFCYSSYVAIKNIVILAIAFSPHNFKILPTRHMEYIGISNPN